jgi:Malectin domain
VAQSKSDIQKFINMKVLIKTAIFLAVAQYVQAKLEVKYAVNAGGGAYTTTYGVKYAADTSTEGYTYIWGNLLGGTTTDVTLHRDCRYSDTQFTYTLPLNQNGFYVVHLTFRDDSANVGNRLFKVVLNGFHILLDKFDICATCGQYNVCNQAFYFTVCNGKLYWEGEASVINYDQVGLTFISQKVNAVVDAILLMKGAAGDALPIIESKNIIFFDPAYETKCVSVKKGSNESKKSKSGEKKSKSGEKKGGSKPKKGRGRY